VTVYLSLWVSGDSVSIAVGLSCDGVSVTVAVCQVTVFGSGSGATSISTLLASSSSHGLFSRAWLSNPSPKPQCSLDEAQLQNEAFFK